MFLSHPGSHLISSVICPISAVDHVLAFAVRGSEHRLGVEADVFHRPEYDLELAKQGVI